MIHPSQLDRADLTLADSGLAHVTAASVHLVNTSNSIGMTAIRRFSPALAAAIEEVETALLEKAGK